MAVIEISVWKAIVTMLSFKKAILFVGSSFVLLLLLRRSSTKALPRHSCALHFLFVVTGSLSYDSIKALLHLLFGYLPLSFGCCLIFLLDNLLCDSKELSRKDVAFVVFNFLSKNLSLFLDEGKFLVVSISLLVDERAILQDEVVILSVVDACVQEDENGDWKNCTHN